MKKKFKVIESSRFLNKGNLENIIGGTCEDTYVLKCSKDYGVCSGYDVTFCTTQQHTCNWYGVYSCTSPKGYLICGAGAPDTYQSNCPTKTLF